MPEAISYRILLPKQSDQIAVFSFKARAYEIDRFARIDRISRDGNGRLTGFQRPQIANHIREIREYRSTPGSILPNPIVIAFQDGVTIKNLKDGTVAKSLSMSATGRKGRS